MAKQLSSNYHSVGAVARDNAPLDVATQLLCLQEKTLVEIGVILCHGFIVMIGIILLGGSMLAARIDRLVALQTPKP